MNISQHKKTQIDADYFDGNSVIVKDTSINLGIRNKNNVIMKGELCDNFTMFKGKVLLLKNSGQKEIIHKDEKIKIESQNFLD